jgi:hypothetical protein
MAGSFYGSIILRGSNGQTSRLKFNLGDTDDFGGASDDADFALAQLALNQIAGSLAAVTDAVLASKELTFVDADDLDPSYPANADIFEKASIVTYLEPVENYPQKYHTLQIPAPVAGIFLGDVGAERDEVDITDTQLQQYVQQLAQHAFVSDGEKIDDTRPNMGIKAGRRVVSRYSKGN